MTSPHETAERIARETAREFINSFGVDECNGGTHSIWCLKLTESIATVLLAAEDMGLERAADTVEGIDVFVGDLTQTQTARVLFRIAAAIRGLKARAG